MEYANKRTHRARLIGATSGSAVYYRIVSGAKVLGPFEAKLPATALVSPEDFMAGQVTYADGTPGADCLVSLRITANVYSPEDGSLVATRDSAWANTMADDVNGKYVIGVTNLREAGNLDSRLVYSNGAGQATVTVSARCDAGAPAILSSFSSDMDVVGGQFLGVDLSLNVAQQ